MAEQTIIIEIDENGKIKAETQGIKGEMCLTELENLLAELIDVQSISTTDEFNQKTQIKNQQNIKNKKS